MKYRKRAAETVEATRWFKNGDHPEDQCTVIETQGASFLSEGKFVRYYRHPQKDGESLCRTCKVRMHDHGWIDVPQHGIRVCPGWWVVRVDGDIEVMSDEFFRERYEQIAAPAARGGVGVSAGSLDDLNAMVTELIIKAEHATGDKARDLWAATCAVEQALAQAHQPGLEQDIAHRGAVSAAFKAGLPGLAGELAFWYGVEDWLKEVKDGFLGCDR